MYETPRSCSLLSKSCKISEEALNVFRGNVHECLKIAIDALGKRNARLRSLCFVLTLCFLFRYTTRHSDVGLVERMSEITRSLSLSLSLSIVACVCVCVISRFSVFAYISPHSVVDSNIPLAKLLPHVVRVDIVVIGRFFAKRRISRRGQPMRR